MIFFLSSAQTKKIRQAADTQRDLKNWDNAIELYEKYISALGQSDRTFPFLVQLGNCLKEAGRFEDALNAYHRAQKINKTDSDLHLQIGHAHKRRGNTRAALASYEAALKYDSSNLFAQDEIISLSETKNKDCLQKDKIWFDVSDILGYFPDNRSPTGIQRVQISILTAIFRRIGQNSISLCRFLEDEDGWHSVDFSTFIEICDLSLEHGSAADLSWRNAVATLHTKTVSAPIDKFPYKSVLFNLGTSWWLPNYFIHIREAKLKSSIYYVPLIHDVIPAATPQYCAHELVHEFIDWLMGVIQHADAYMAVSASTKADFLSLAEKFDILYPEDSIRVMHLAAERQPATPPISLDKSMHPEISALASTPYVLFVSTVESRKNQVSTLQVWASLYRRHGDRFLPKLVIVGKKGFESHFFIEKLQNLVVPDNMVVYVESVSDGELDFLYRNCLFTVYPSFYEGWGLPITESLGYGKVAVTADNSSLPEAGQNLTELFKTGSNADFEEKVYRLISDSNYRKSRETNIQKHFVERGWNLIAQEMLQYAAELSKRSSEPRNIVPLLSPGYYSLNRNRKLHVEKGMTSSESLRIGTGWHRLEDFGAWTKPAGGKLRFMVSEKVRRIAIQVKGTPTQSSEVHILSNLSATLTKGEVGADMLSWLFVENEALEVGSPIEIAISSHGSEVVFDKNQENSRVISVGVSAIFISGQRNPNYQTDFIEDCLFDLLKYRKISRLPCISAE